MSLETLGEMTLGAAIPMLGDAATALDAAVALEVPRLSAAAAVFADVSGSIVVSPPAAAIFVEAAAAFQPPTVDVNFGLDAAADFNAEVGQLNVYGALALQIADLLATAGVSAYLYQGRADEFAMPPYTAGAPSGATQVFGIVLACQASATSTVSALRAVFGVTP
jgi:hypothetical protein